MKKKLWIAAILAFTLIIAIPASILAEGEAPQYPAFYWGTATFYGPDDEIDAPAGTVISAKVDGENKGNITVIEAGKYGDYDAQIHLLVQGNITPGSTINFFANDHVADQTGIFVESSLNELNLTIEDSLPPDIPGNITRTTPDSDDTPAFVWDASADNLSGIASYEVRIDDGGWTDIGNVLTYTADVINEGSHIFYVRAKDKVGNIGTEGSLDFLIAIPPVISGVNASDITEISAVINWETDEPATSLVEYGTTTAYGLVTPLVSTLVTDHSITLSGLNPSTTYHYIVRSVDELGTEGVSEDNTFTTLDDTTPPVISGVAASAVTTTTATIIWTTDEPATSEVEYGATTDYGMNTPLDPNLVTSHSVTLNGLNPDSTYHYKVISKDTFDNEAISTDFTFTTAEDLIPPVISDVSSSVTGPTTAIISWTTSEAATSQVQYGTTITYGSFTTLDPALIMIHDVALEGLQPNTLYHYSVISKDASGNETVSGDFTFTTLPDTTPPIISDIDVMDISPTRAVVYWNTDEPATSQVAYGLDTGYGYFSPLNTFLVFEHGVVLTGLTPDTTYHFMVISEDTWGNEAVSGDLTFTTLPDTTPPDISAINAADITSTRAIIYWKTGEPATSQVEYGLDTGYGYFSPLNTYLVFEHGVVLTGLTPDTTYHYRVISKDASENEAVSGDFTFTTSDDTTPPTTSEPYVSNITSTTAVVYWTTNEPATSQVEYGTTTSYGTLSPLNPNLVYSHGVLLAGLTNDTTYHYRVISIDAYGNSEESDDYIFTTALDIIPPEITGVTQCNVGSTSVIILWLTNEPADSQVEYGTTSADHGSYDAVTALDTNLVTSHGAALSGLTPGITYFYRVISSDADGNWSVSNEYSFDAVDSTPPDISEVSAVAITINEAAIIWITDEDATTQIEYGTVSAAHGSYESQTAFDGTLRESHVEVLSGLASGTRYYYRVISRDAVGNESISEEYSFTTK